MLKFCKCVCLCLLFYHIIKNEDEKEISKFRKTWDRIEQICIRMAQKKIFVKLILIYLPLLGKLFLTKMAIFLQDLNIFIDKKQLRTKNCKIFPDTFGLFIFLNFASFCFRTFCIDALRVVLKVESCEPQDFFWQVFFFVFFS